jgi:hypothetical protein
MLNYQRVSQILGFHGMDFLSKLFEMRRVHDGMILCSRRLTTGEYGDLLSVEVCSF